MRTTPIDALAWLALASAAAAAAAAYLTGRRGLALGVLFTTASFSGLTAPLGTLNVRFEQPAVATLAFLIAVREPSAVREILVRARGPLAMVGLYIGASLASSVLMSPEPFQSLKITGWFAVSVIAGVIAGVLVLRGDGTDLGLRRWIVAGAVAQSLVAAIQVIVEVATDGDWGVLKSDALIGKAYGLSWEPNLLAISLAVGLMFLLVPQSSSRDDRGWSRYWRPVALVVISAGLALALSRGGIVGLVIALLCVSPAVVSSCRRIGNIAAVRAFAARSVLALTIAIAGYAALSAIGDGGALLPGDIIGGSGAVPTLVPATSSGPPATTPGDTVIDTASGYTIELRLRNMRTAIADGLRSPIIGLGPDTFGARYTEPTCKCRAQIPNLVAAAIYESGLLGFLGLATSLVLVLLGLWRTRRYDYFGALIVLIVGYQFTDALRFASNWILIGGSIALPLVTRTMSIPAPRDTPLP